MRRIDLVLWLMLAFSAGGIFQQWVLTGNPWPHQTTLFTCDGPDGKPFICGAETK